MISHSFGPSAVFGSTSRLSQPVLGQESRTLGVGLSHLLSLGGHLAVLRLAVRLLYLL